MPEAEYVLVVEDSEVQATSMRMFLADAGYRVGWAPDGRAGLESCRRELPHLVVTDLHMPEMNGLELVRALKRELPSLPVMLTTAEGSEEIATQALRSGASSYVPKRMLAEMFVPTVNQLLSLAHADRMAQRLAGYQTSAELNFALSNDETLVPHVIARLRDQVEQMAVCTEQELLQVATALDESLLNAMIHGNLEVSSKLRDHDCGAPYRQMIKQRQAVSPYRERRVHVHVAVTREKAAFVIRDEGPGFDPTKIPDPRDPANLANLSGRGLLLIHAFMDEVQHNTTGNEITMVKRKKDCQEACTVGRGLR